MEYFKVIKDISYKDAVGSGLVYSSPCRGGWNIVHYGTLVPGGHMIFVCPVSCLRGVVLTTAEMGPDAMKLLSTITVGEDNILNGDMEEELRRGTEKVIESLPVRPRMVMIFTSCIHHFLTVNYQRIYKILREEYPDIDFIDCYMDPIMRKKTPPMANLKRQILRVLKPAEKADGQVNFVGNCFPMGENCDLTNFLTENGIKIYDLSTIEDYDDFHKMEQSKVNFTFHANAAWAAKDLKVRLSQGWVAMRETYDYDAIDEDMKKAAESLGLAPLSKERIREEREKTEKAVAVLKEHIGDTPLAIDDTAVDRPLELALYLLKHGFKVESVVMESKADSEEVFEQVKKLNPELKIYSAENWTMRRAHFTHEGKLIGIGARSAYARDTGFFVDINENAGLYGYAGIRELCRLIAEAAENEQDTHAIVTKKGWHCNLKEGCII